MRYLLKSRRFWLLPLALAMACATWVVAAMLGENEDAEDIYNRWLHHALLERQATDLQDLSGRFLRDQELYLWISPPDPEFILFQPGETIPILDLKAFPASFIDNLAGEIGADGVVRFPVWIYEDADSPGREIVIESLEQKVIARIGRDQEYSPEWFVRALYPALDTYEEWRRDWLTACYDPARVCMRYDLLVGEDNLIQYVWARSIEAARLAEEREAAAMMRSGEGGSVSNLQFTAIGTTINGTIGLTLAWPDEGLGTNVVDIFACTDLCARDWTLADTLTLDMQTNRVVWVDAESTNRVRRFYDAWTHHDSDGDGIPDGREVRLYGTDPHNWDTDGDGLSDSAELFVHGTSALNADSDGDGLPDGWEVQYGLDPLDATGANGADGDPDGDGFTNLQEFQMGGDPANPAINATQLIHRLMHCRGDSSLRVDVEDSENCGGTNPNRQEVEDVFSVGPLMHCGYLLSLTVEGRVEDHNSGFDKVSVRAYTATELQSEVPFFEGHNNGNGCAMVDEQATTNVWFWSNGSVRLRYDTGDGLYHTDAYAEIVSASEVSTFEVLAIEPDAMTNLHEIEDGDGNPRTRVFVVPIAQALEWPVDSVVVRALISPNMDESDLPDCMSLQGGSGGDKLTRYVSRTTQAGPSKTEFTFSCGGTNVGFTTTVYVYDAKVGLFADEGDLQNLEVGHSWGQYSLDAFAQELVPEEHRDYIDYIGFWPSIAGNPSCVGDVRLGVAAVDAHWPSGQKMYPIRFAPLAFALSQVKASDDSPPWYHLFNYNCTDYAIGIGEIVYVYTMDPDGVSTPWEFSAWLNNH